MSISVSLSVKALRFVDIAVLEKIENLESKLKSNKLSDDEAADARNDLGLYKAIEKDLKKHLDNIDA